MNFSKPFIHRPVMTILLMASILFFGLMAYQTLPVSDLPNVDMPTIQVSVDYPGASPETMANAVTTPLEQEFMTIEGMQTIFSSSTTSSSSIILQFDLDRDIDAASTDVQAAISRAQSNLPSYLPNQPTYKKTNPAATPILYYAISAPNMTLGELFDYGKSFIGDRLSMIEGVSQVMAYGYPYAVRIQVDPEKLAAKNIGLGELTQQVRSTNVDLPLGTLYGNRDDYTIDVDGQIKKAPGYDHLIIKNANGELVKLKDIGHSLDSTQNDKFFQSYVTKSGTSPCIVLAIRRLPGMNTVEITKQLKEKMLELRPLLPSSLIIELIYDQSVAIISKVDEVKLTLLIAFLLVVTVIYFYLGKALNTIIPSLALPMSVFGTFALMHLYGFSIDVLSLLALTLSIGFLVDDAIVVLENTVRHVQMGHDPLTSAIESAKEISVTVISMTLCLAAAFIPMLFLGGIVGKLFREFAVTIVTAVLISGIISLTLIPMLSARLISPYSEKKKPRMEKISDAVNDWLRARYKPCLIWALKHRLIMLGLGTSCIVFSFVLFKLVPKDFLPPDNTGYIQGYTLARDGTSPFLMDSYHKKINEVMIKNPNVESILSIGSSANDNEGFLFLKLTGMNVPNNEVINALTNELQMIAGINTYLSPLPLVDLQVGTTATALYQYSLSSINPDALYAYAPKLLAKMKQNPHFTQVSSDLRINQPHFSMKILREKASNYNVSAAEIENYFQYAYSNNKISQINASLNQYDVLVETLPRFYKDPSVLSKLYVTSTKGHQVPLSELVTVEEKVGPLTVNHVDGIASVGISFNLADGIPLETGLNILHSLVDDIPPQVLGQVIGTADVFKSSFARLNFLLFLTFFAIYVILGILYESFIHPLTVMSALPPTVVGGLLTLYLFNEPLSLYSFVGLILLIGIVLKNGIMMVDFAIAAMEKEGKSAHDAIIEASLIRFRPILMTTICAGLGAVPIALNLGDGMGETRVSLGLCIIGGLLISQPLTLLLTPVLYYYFEQLQEKLFKKKQTR